MARWVVIGGTGYIGEALCRYLLCAGHTVLSVSRAPTGPKGCEHFSLDLSPDSDFSHLFHPGDRVVYTAGMAGRGDCESDAQGARWLNSDCPVQVLRCADVAGAESFVCLSSVKSMRPPVGVLADEECGVPATDVYGYSKWLGEQQLLAEKVGCRVNLIRPASVYGSYGEERSTARGRAQRWRSIFCTWGRFAPLIPATGSRSFISLPDLLSAIVQLAEAGHLNRRVFIAAEPRFYDLAAIASAASGVRIRASCWLASLLLAPLRPIRRVRFAHQLLELEQSELYSAARLRNALPWRAQGRYSQYLRGAA